MTVNWGRAYFESDEIVLELDRDDRCVTSVNVLKMSELYTFNE